MSFQVVLDVGSSKVSALACRTRGGRTRVLGYGVVPIAAAAHGVTNDALVTSAIRAAVDQVERSAGIRADAVHAGIAQPRDGGFDPQRVAEREALLLRVEHAGLRVIGLVPNSVASAAATLTAEERAAGIALADIGAGTTDVVVCRDGEVVVTHVIGFGAAKLTTSIAACFRISCAEAEFLKRNVGCAAPDLLDSDYIVAVPSCARGGGTFVTRREIARLIAVQLAPLWRSLAHVLQVIDDVPLAITGGGSLLDGSPELAERMLARSVRRANPFGLIDLPGELQGPGFATIAGLAHYVGSQTAHRAKGHSTWGRRRLASA